MSPDDPINGRFPRRMPWIVTGLVLAVYSLTAANWDLTRPIGFHHQAAQAEAFLNGRLHIEGYPEHEELAHYQGRAYIAAPPGPAVAFVPFVFLVGPHFNPIPLHFAAAAAGVGLLWSVLRVRGNSEPACLAAVLGVAFGTVLWWCARRPGSWHTAHVLSFFFLSLALWVAHRRNSPLAVGLLVAGSALCRQLTLFAFPFFLFYLARRSDNGGQRHWRGTSLRFLLGLSSPIIAYMVFNWARFGDPLEGGYGHLYIRSPGLERFQQFGLFNVHYLPENVYTTLFAAPRPSPDFPFLVPELMGQALIFTSPFLFYAFCGKGKDRERFVVWMCVLLILGPQLLYFNNGFAQFGYRFALDFIPLLILPAAEGMPQRFSAKLTALILISIALNAIGVYML